VVDTATCEVHCDVMRSYGNPWVSVRPELMRQIQIILHAVMRPQFYKPVFWVVMALRLGYYGPPYPYRPHLVPRDFHFFGTLKK